MATAMTWQVHDTMGGGLVASRSSQGVLQMTRVVVDATMRAHLNNLADLLEVCDESGRVLGYFHPVPAPNPAAPVQSPVLKEELEHRRRQRTGRSLTDILKGLQRS
jgi:hypothetical protein